MSEVEKIKWQIHAETSINQATLWTILGVLIGGWFWLIAGTFIIGNIITSLTASAKIGKGYFRS